MSEAEQLDDIEVEIEQEEGWLGDEEKAEAAPVESEESNEEDLAAYSESVKKRIATLTKRYREAERQRDAAAEYAKQVAVERDQFRQRMEALDKGYVGEYESRVNTEIANVQAQLRHALDMHDTDSAVKAQTRLAELTGEKQRVAQVRASQNRQVEQQPQYDPRLAQQMYAPQQPQRPQPDQKAQAWATRNEWFGTDRVLTQAAMGVHEQLVEEEGFDPQSDEYYSELDRRMSRFLPEKQKQGTRPTQAVAGASRSSGGAGQTGNGRRIRLTKSEVEMANRLGVPLADYARYVKR